MRFFLVHELSCSNGAGRLRARACRPMTQVQAEILADTLDAIDGVEGVRVNPRVPSVLVLYRACAGPAGRAPLPGCPGRRCPQ